MKFCDIHIGGLFLITLSTFVSSVPLHKANKISRHTREAESLKEQLQKLRQILRDVNDKDEQTTLPTTTNHESVDDIFNKIVDDLKHGDKAGVLLLANALKKLRREHENEDDRNGDGVGDYLGQNNNGQHEDQPMGSDKILDVLRKLYNKEREKSLKKHEYQPTTLPTTTTTVSQDNTDLRIDVLHAIEKRLLRDIGIAVNYGFTPQEIIKDLQKQASKRISPRSINNNYMEKDLKTLKSATKVYLEDK
ncbi:hypothetical protein LOTGIDRAFT_239128 [Lottia gigantea]|uniref:Uncharacterized protein n=1 Tax=Lottia gigantea TaxID=225164 RepID=V4A2G9_LOTGI|nr:hypothetical protein LOTGIDRAFT_239128 [Lottia gigantea]ESO98058.1 hypothetical protein LOTGIDRAFT_239128 [Lottia gigantea]